MQTHRRVAGTAGNSRRVSERALAGAQSANYGAGRWSTAGRPAAACFAPHPSQSARTDNPVASAPGHGDYGAADSARADSHGHLNVERSLAAPPQYVCCRVGAVHLDQSYGPTTAGPADPKGLSDVLDLEFFQLVLLLFAI